MNILGFQGPYIGPYIALNQEGLTDPRLNSAIARAVQNGLVTPDGHADLLEADLVISDLDN